MHTLPSPQSCCNMCSGVTVTIDDSGSGGGGGSGNAILFGPDDPTAAPEDPSIPWEYLNTTTNVTFMWNPVTQSW